MPQPVVALASAAKTSNLAGFHDALRTKAGAADACRTDYVSRTVDAAQPRKEKVDNRILAP
jgi:hypothetical protein